MPISTTRPLALAVVTGGHPFDVAGFHALFRALAGIETTILHLEEWAASSHECRQAYDVVLFYHMVMDLPVAQPDWHQGAISSALSELGATSQGVVILHHALLAFPQWPFWSDLVGISDRSFRHHLGEQPHYVIADQEHPITRNLADWDMQDETYTMAEPQTDCAVLVASAHQKSMRTIAWTRQVGHARVFNFQSGHDAHAWGDKTFIEILRRGIRWTAAKDVELPATMDGVDFPEKGRAALRKEPTPMLIPGHLLCRTLVSGVTNGTERNLLMGGNYGGTWPCRCAYQNVAEVIDVGAGVSEFAIGDRIFNGDFTGHVQFFLADAKGLSIALPATIRSHDAALFGMASVAVHDVRRARITLGEQVLIVGAGPVGQFAAQAARACGAVVTVVDLDRRRLDLALQLGAHHVIDAAQGWAPIRAAGPFDCVIEASGAPVLDEILGVSWGGGVVRHRSRLVLIAGRGRVDYSFNAGQGHELEILQAGHFTRDDLEQICRLVSKQVIRMAPIIQEVLPISEAPSFYDRLRDQPQDTFGTVFVW